MLRKALALVLLLAPCCAGLAPAQQTTPAKSSPEAARGPQRMAEDVEIMRRILNRTVEGMFTDTTPEGLHWRMRTAVEAPTMPVATAPAAVPSVSAAPDVRYTWHIANAPVKPGTEGVYLKGHGVLFTLTLPASRFREAPEAAVRPSVKPLSDWERTRKEVRGETLSVTWTIEQRRPRLREVILKVLAENGRHLEQLNDAEHVTVVVTLRPDGSAETAGDPREHWRRTYLDLTGREPTAEETERFADRPVAVTKAIEALLPNPNSPNNPFEPAATPNEQELLGDLHLKQNRHAEAVKAFTAALAMARTARDSVGLYRKLAQAELGKGDTAAAEAALAKARAALEHANNKEVRGAGSKALLPGKLVVSASKKQLDQVASGKLTFEEFLKAATVDFQPFNSVPKAGE